MVNALQASPMYCQHICRRQISIDGRVWPKAMAKCDCIRSTTPTVHRRLSWVASVFYSFSISILVCVSSYFWCENGLFTLSSVPNFIYLNAICYAFIPFGMAHWMLQCTPSPSSTYERLARTLVIVSLMLSFVELVARSIETQTEVLLEIAVCNDGWRSWYVLLGVDMNVPSTELNSQEMQCMCVCKSVCVVYVRYVGFVCSLQQLLLRCDTERVIFSTKLDAVKNNFIDIKVYRLTVSLVRMCMRPFKWHRNPSPCT